MPFNEYCSAMREDGTWAGHLELQATSLVTGCNICIHQVKAAILLSERIWFYSRQIVDSVVTANYYYNFCASCALQLKTPRWHIRNFESVDTFTLHL